MSVVVAVDGPAGSGKSSVSRAAAAALGYGFLDTGSAYRALAWRALDAGVDPSDEEAVQALLPGFAWSSALDPAEHWVRVGTTDVTGAVREPRVTAVVSAIARIPEVREHLTALFRDRIATAEPGVVVEGRDITTVVAPDAEVRVLLTADPQVRAQRRSRELPGTDTSTVAKAIAERDAKDAEVVDFLSAAPGVTELDSTHLDFDQTVDALVAIVRKGADHG